MGHDNMWNGQRETMRKVKVKKTKKVVDTVRSAHCLDSQLTDGNKIVSPTYRPHFTSRLFLLDLIILIILGREQKLWR
jgi:hypothetical protein